MVNSLKASSYCTNKTSKTGLYKEHLIIAAILNSVEKLLQGSVQYSMQVGLANVRLMHATTQILKKQQHCYAVNRTWDLCGKTSRKISCPHTSRWNKSLTFTLVELGTSISAFCSVLAAQGKKKCVILRFCCKQDRNQYHLLQRWKKCDAFLYRHYEILLITPPLTAWLL